jgi:hypothetical protein
MVLALTRSPLLGIGSAHCLSFVYVWGSTCSIALRRSLPSAAICSNLTSPSTESQLLSGLKKRKKTAHRKIKPKGGLSYSLAEVISLAFGLSPQTP